MRFTQFGHQVPRRNSRIPGVPRCNASFIRENLPAQFAASSSKSGASSPTRKVDVWSSILNAP